MQAILALEDGRIVGSIGVLNLCGNDYELRRMYVDANHRGRGIAQKLVDVLFQWCREHKVAALYLETNEQWKAAHHIYEKNGFETVPRDNLPANFPVVRVATDFYRKVMAPPNQSFQPTFSTLKPRGQRG